MQSNTSLNIIVFSTFDSEYAPFVLKEIYDAGFTVSALVLDGVIREKDKQIQEERMRGFFKWPDFSSIEVFQVPIYLVRDHNGATCQELIKKFSPDVIINGGTPRILKEPILSLYPHVVW